MDHPDEETPGPAARHLARQLAHQRRGFKMAMVLLVLWASAAPAFARLDRPGDPLAWTAGFAVGTGHLPGRPVLPRGVRVLGPVGPDLPLSLRLLLEPSDPGGLARAAVAVATRGTPEFHRFVSTSQFAARFGPPPSVVRRLTGWARAAGLEVAPYRPGDLALGISGSAAAVESALRVPLERVALGSGVTAYANTGAPVLPAGAFGILGLDDLVRARPAASDRPPYIRSPVKAAATVSATPCAASQMVDVYSPGQVAAAYGITPLYSAGATGAGQTIALIEFSDFADSDVATFRSCFGIPSGSVARVAVDGGVPAGPGPGTAEATFDIEDVLSFAPALSVLAYEGPNSAQGIYDAYAAAVNSNRAAVISTSWGICEPHDTQALVSGENLLFQKAAVQGQTVLAAAGDAGSEDCNTTATPDTTLQVDDPASQPYVTGVGGTTITSPTPRSETVWNDSAGAGGGGASKFWSRPAWQTGSGLVASASSPNPCGSATGSCREVPDVAASADPYHGYPVYCNAGDCSGAGWVSGGGTSLAAPLWGAVVALEDQECPSSGNRAGFLNPSLYTSASTNDVTTGSNDFTRSHGGSYAAGPSYDMASGLGSPSGSSLLAGLCAGTGSTTGGTGGTGTSPGVGAPAGHASPAGITFPDTPVYTASPPQSATLTSTGSGFLNVDSVAVQGVDPSDFKISSDTCAGASLAPGSACSVSVYFEPIATGARAASLKFSDDDPAGPQTVSLSGSGLAAPGRAPAVAPEPGPTTDGYRFVAADGGVFDFGQAAFFGSTGGTRLQKPITGMAATPDSGGYWLVAADGGVFNFGDARYFGSAASGHPKAPVVGMAATPDGGGYWLVSADGGVYAFGDAVYHGSAGGLPLASPIVGMAVDPATGGYWLVGSDGGIFSYDAPFLGSTGALRLNRPIVGMTAQPDGKGYRFVASDGGVFCFGDATFAGSTGALRLAAPVVGLTTTHDGSGYWLVASDGGIFSFGDARFFGSTGNIRLAAPIVGMSA